MLSVDLICGVGVESLKFSWLFLIKLCWWILLVATVGEYSSAIGCFSSFDEILMLCGEFCFVYFMGVRGSLVKKDFGLD